jgi:hypothetical protein
VNSTLNDPEGKWLESHRVNRYRDWDELRYSIRSVEKYAGTFRNKIQLLVNAVANPNEAADATVDNPATIVGKQKPLWLKDDAETNDVVQVLSQEDFFDETEQSCLPTFNSLTIENQIFNTKSDTDRVLFQNHMIQVLSLTRDSSLLFPTICSSENHTQHPISTHHFSDLRWDSKPTRTTP